MWDHTEKGMKHCLKQTIARCQSSKYFPSMKEFIRMCKEPVVLGNVNSHEECFDAWNQVERIGDWSSV